MTILLIDDHDLVLKGLHTVLGHAFPDACFLTARNGREAIEAAHGTHVDLAVLDLELPDIPGFRLIELLRGEAPGIRIVVNTVHEEIWTLRQLEQSGVDGTVFKSVDSSELIQTVRRVLEAPAACLTQKSPAPFPAQRHPGQLQPSQTASGSKTGTGCSPLSPKELEVLQLVADGKDSREIASILYITENTVESHRSHIMRKLGATNAADMVMKAITLGLIPPARLQ
jgi:DNA-binding NarL/FixJ family response regulator